MSTENKPNNPTAFPYTNENNADYKRGMTLRDYFANSAMQGHLASEYYVADCSQENKESLAKIFYDFADAMLKQREL